MLVDHLLALLGGEAEEREHANLRGNVVPVTLAGILYEGSLEGNTHAIHAVSHCLELNEPLCAVLRVNEDFTSDTATMDRRRRIVRSDDDFNLRKNLLSGGLVRADDVEGTSTLTVETHGLGEGLSDNHLETFLDEVADSVSVLIQAA